VQRSIGRRIVTLWIGCILLATGCSGDDTNAADCDVNLSEWAGLDPDDNAEGGRRSELAHAIVDCGLFEGASRAEVASQLGESADSDSSRWEFAATRTFADYELLVVEFGPDGVVSSVSISQS
jgi:hypothetical protein